jgi:hypothetical protein
MGVGAPKNREIRDSAPAPVPAQGSPSSRFV